MSPTVVISGIGRSGTGYVAAVLNNCGLLAGHEAVFAGGRPAKPATRAALDASGLDVEVSGFAMPHLSDPSFRDLPVVLCVRHPLDWLASWHAKRFAHTYLREHLAHAFADEWGQPQPDHGFDTSGLWAEKPINALLIWAAWTMAVAERAVFYFQVEQLGTHDVEQIAILGNAYHKLNLIELPRQLWRVPRNVHSTRRGSIPHRHTWDTVESPHKRLAQHVARRFGYR